MLPLVLSVGYIFIALRCKGANSRHIMQEFGEKFSYFFVARGLMGRIVQKVCVFLREKACFRAIYCSICTKNPRACGQGIDGVWCYRYLLSLSFVFISGCASRYISRKGILNTKHTSDIDTSYLYPSGSSIVAALYI